MVERNLAKVDTRVRFPSLAPSMKCAQGNLSFFFQKVLQLDSNREIMNKLLAAIVDP